MIEKLGFQLYSVRDFMTDPDVADVAFKKLAQYGYSEVHTAGNYMSDEALGELCKKHNMTIIGSHYDYKKILEDPETTMAVHNAWGTKNVGIGGMPREVRDSLAGVKGFIDEFNRAAELYAKHGFRLTYHHHNFEFARIDGYKTIMDLLYENLDPKNTAFVLDTCWISAGGGDVCAWLEKCAGRVDILHLKEMALKKEDKNFVPYITEVGNGNIAWEPVIKTAEKLGIKHYIVEQDHHFSPNSLASLKISADYLKKFMV